MMRFLTALALSLLLCTGSALAQSAPKHYLSTNTNNSTLVFANKAFVNGGVAINTTATIYYLKLYNKATAPTCGTDTPVWTIPVLGTQSVPIPPIDANFYLGVGFCIVAGIADNDNTVAAAGVVVNLGVSGR